ncbi:hypothetical protein FIBSPDRAFT_784613 [Athelia psychrophila]|uniref:Uncharacterized protein n=1 Tax=Athelia psychrophila TaxID=1759441 RepID=A0A166N6J6_9AGAM|nr:hypothetical protein FIBSPDRAFT_784613 [Fibularhizoctonia sp. CBS 109695]
MDDPFASPWGAPSATPSPNPVHLTLAPPAAEIPSSSSSSQLGDDDFDDFGTAPTAPSDAMEDDFGDFGDFGDAGDMAAPGDFEDAGFGQEVRITSPPPSQEWEPLRLNPFPSKAELHSQLDDLLGPTWTADVSQYTTADDVREVEGISQILVAPESRDLYNALFHAPPPMKPPNWTRSRIRQQHLISLGIPVNLDEIMPYAAGKALPPLQITTRPMSAPPVARNLPQSIKPAASTNNSRANSRANSRTGTPVSTTRPSTVSQLGLGPKPQLEEAKVTELLAVDPDTLPLMPLASLERHLAEIRAQTVNTSGLLTHLLQTREALQQDSETYNGLIAELVSEAQKTKISKGKQPNSKRGSMM